MMNQLQLMEPQFECGLFEIWCIGIIDTLVYRVNCGLDDVPFSVNLSQTFDDRLKNWKILNLSDICSSNSELYAILLTKTGYLVRRNCADLCDPCDKLMFKTRFLDLILMNILREKKILTQSTEYFYESVLDIFPQVTFGLSFVMDLMADQGWYKYSSKFLRRFSDPRQVELITKEFYPSSLSDCHLNVLFVIWSIESILKQNDPQALQQFKESTDQLINQRILKSLDLRKRLTIYLTIINVTLEEFIGSSAHEAARILGLDKQHETEDPVNPILPKVTIHSVPIKQINEFIIELERNLFPNNELTNFNELKMCLEEGKSESIVEMVASIHELNSFIRVLRREMSLPELRFECFDTIAKGMDEWAPINMDDVRCQELFAIKRFFTLDREECRFLTCVVIKHGLPKYFDILESIDLDIYLDPFVIFTFCDIIQLAGEFEDDSELFNDLILIVKRILTSIKSKKRITSLIKARANLFGLCALGNVKKKELSSLLRQQSGSMKCDQIRDEILLAAFLAPYELLDCVIADTVEHAHQMIPFLVKLFCIELNGLMSQHCETKYDNTLFETIIETRLSIYPTDNTNQGLLKLIKEVFLFYVYTKDPVQPWILSLERLMCHLAWDGCINPKITVSAKLAIYKLIRALSDQHDHILWTYVEREPATLIYGLVTMIEYHYTDGSLKVPYIELISFIMNKKVKRKLTSKEWHWMYSRMERLGENSLLLAYLEPWLEDRLSLYFDVKTLTLGDTLLMASICKNNKWISYLIHHDMRGESPNLSNSIGFIMQFLSRPEYDNLFLFLCQFNIIDWAMNAICYGYISQEADAGINVQYETDCVIDCIHSHYLEFMKNPDKYIRESNRKIPDYYVPDDELLCYVFRRIAVCFYHKNIKDNKRLTSYLLQLSKEMQDKGIDVHKALFSRPNIFHDQALVILRVHHDRCFYIPPEPKIVIRPI